jgi:proline iminopeptidase
MEYPWSSVFADDGVRISYVDNGNVDSPAVIFVHGGPGFNSSYLMHFGSKLATPCRVILYDQRGSGRSDRQIDLKSISMDRFVDDLHQLTEHLGLREIILFGHSFGGALALEFTLRYPSFARGIILEGSYADALITMQDRLVASHELAVQTGDQELIRILAGIAESGMPSYEAFAVLCGEKTASLYWGDLAHAANFVLPSPESWGYSREEVNTNMKVLEAFYRIGLLRDYSLLGRVHKVLTPVLVTGGRKDRIITERQLSALSALLPNSTMKIFDQSGHYPHIEEEDAFLGVVRGFIGFLAANPSGPTPGPAIT